MWDESLIESRKKRSGKWGWSTTSISVVLHGVGILVVVLATFWNVEAVPPTFPPQQFVQSAGVPMDNIPVVLRKGTPDGDDKPVKPAETAVLEPAPVTQDSIDPNSDPSDVPDLPQSTVPFNFAPDGDYGTGPIGSPEGNSPDGALFGPSGAGEPDPVIDITVGVEQPVLIHRVVPEYPESMRIIRKSGIVILKAIVSRNGDVEVKEVQRSLHPILDREAIRAVNQWKYRPATVNGRPVSVWFTVTVSFKLV